MLSVSRMKGNMMGGSVDAPREGSRMRALYDAFLTNRGYSIPITHSSDRCRIDQLKNFYGFDIVYVSKLRYALIGEWFGSRYVDYRVRA